MNMLVRYLTCILWKRVRQEIIDNVQLISNHHGGKGFKVELSRLPEERYPIQVDGKAIIRTVLSWFYSLEKIKPFKKCAVYKGVHVRI